MWLDLSAEATAWAKATTTGDPTRKSILRALADYAGPGNAGRDVPAEADGRHFTFVGIDRLADECECSPRTVIRHLNALAERGMIARVRRMDGLTRTSNYTILAVDSAGPRPFDEGEIVLARALAEPEGDNLAPSAVTCESVNVSPAVGANLSRTEGDNLTPPKVSSVQPEGDTGDTFVPYTDYQHGPTSVNSQPREVAEPLTGVVVSGHTTLAEQQRFWRGTTGEIMESWKAWCGTSLPPGQEAEARREVHKMVTAGVDRRHIAQGLADWTRDGFSSRSLESFVRQAIGRYVGAGQPQSRGARGVQERRESLVTSLQKVAARQGITLTTAAALLPGSPA